MPSTTERPLGWLYVESLVVLALLFPNRRDKATEQFLLALPSLVKRPPGLASLLPPVREVVSAVQSAQPTVPALTARFRRLAALVPEMLEPEAARQWSNQARYVLRLRSHALGDPDDALEALSPPRRAPEAATAEWQHPPVPHPIERHPSQEASGRSGRRHHRRRHRARWVAATVALACLLGAAAWFWGRDALLPSRHLAEVAQTCAVRDALGGTIWFGATSMPESTRLTRAEACAVGEALAAKTHEFLRLRVAQICDPVAEIVRNRFGGDYSAAMASAQRLAAAGDANAGRAYATLARCRTEESRAGLLEDVRRELATAEIHYGVFSVGQFVADGRICRGYVEQVRVENKSARAQAPDTRYGLSGLGECAGFRFAPEGLFDLGRRLEGLLPGDYIRQTFRYDGVLPETWTFGGRGYNFVSAGSNAGSRAVAASGAPRLVRPPLDAPEGDVLKAFREIGGFEGARLRDVLADPGLASAFWAIVPRGYESCAVRLADSVGPFRRQPDGAVVFDAPKQADGSRAFAAAYLHPAGIIHIALDVTGCGRAGPAIAYFAAADPTELRPAAMDKWLAGAMTVPRTDAFWETDASRRPLAIRRRRAPTAALPEGASAKRRRGTSPRNPGRSGRCPIAPPRPASRPRDTTRPLSGARLIGVIPNRDVADPPAGRLDAPVAAHRTEQAQQTIDEAPVDSPERTAAHRAGWRVHLSDPLENLSSNPGLQFILAPRASPVARKAGYASPTRRRVPG